MLQVKIFALHEGVLCESEEHEVDYVSLVNSDTFGPPPLVAPTRDRNDPRAHDGDRVLYINTNIVPAFQIERDGE